MASPLIQVEAAERRFDGRRVLGPVDLRLRQGETVAVERAKGAGNERAVVRSPQCLQTPQVCFA